MRKALRLTPGEEVLSDESIVLLYKDRRASLVRMCIRRIGDVHAAEDIVQETFYRALQLGLDPARAPIAWLRTVARNLCTDHYRARSRDCLQSDVGADALPSVPDAVDDVHDRVDSAVELAQLRKAVGTLSLREREILLLRDGLQQSYEAIALRDGGSLAATRNVAFRARKTVRNFMAGQGGLAAFVLLLRSRMRAGRGWLAGSSSVPMAVTCLAASLAVAGGFAWGPELTPRRSANPSAYLRPSAGPPHLQSRVRLDVSASLELNASATGAVSNRHVDVVRTRDEIGTRDGAVIPYRMWIELEIQAPDGTPLFRSHFEHSCRRDSDGRGARPLVQWC